MRRQRVRRIILATLFLAFPLVFNYFSPYLMITGAAERVITMSAVVWGLYLLSGVVFGRAACGWFCPFSALQMIWDKVAPRPLKRVRFLPWMKYVLWAGWVGAFVAVLAWRLAADVAAERHLSAGRARSVALGTGLTAGVFLPLVLG